MTDKIASIVLDILARYPAHPFTQSLRRAAGDRRRRKGSLLITSQVPIGRWHEIIGDPTLGDAILDRVIHRSHRIELKGESLRKRHALAAAEGLTNAKENENCSTVSGNCSTPRHAVHHALLRQSEHHDTQPPLPASGLW